MSEIFPNSYKDIVQAGLDANKPTTPNVPPDGSGFTFYYATDTGILYVYDPKAAAWVTRSPGSPQTYTAAAAPANATQTYLVSAVAGFTVTLPAATGTGNRLKFVVKTTLTSGSYEWSCSGSDTMGGTIIASKSTTPTPYQATAGTTVNVTLAFTTVGAGLKGDVVEFQDIASGLWNVQGHTWVTGTVATPFS